MELIIKAVAVVSASVAVATTVGIVGYQRQFPIEYEGGINNAFVHDKRTFMQLLLAPFANTWQYPNRLEWVETDPDPKMPPGVYFADATITPQNRLSSPIRYIFFEKETTVGKSSFRIIKDGYAFELP
jgi:hypothetical protein